MEQSLLNDIIGCGIDAHLFSHDPIERENVRAGEERFCLIRLGIPDMPAKPVATDPCIEKPKVNWEGIQNQDAAFKKLSSLAVVVLHLVPFW